MILVDTNILVHAANPLDVLNAVSQRATARLLSQGEDLCIAPQNLVEFWAVATRPTSQRNGLGMDVAAAEQELESIQKVFHVLAYPLTVPRIWQRLVVTHRVLGKQVHDAHLVAMMQAHAITSVLTFNSADFTRYPGIKVLDPVQV